ncbi:hypothetical protein CHARACLAT_024989, partial [Characodon lateralis]|nr:hypothetical protein [Characodon lateralis]
NGHHTHAAAAEVGLLRPNLKSAIIACVIAAILAACREVIGYIFTSDQDILLRVSEVMIIFCFTHLCDAVAGVTGGVLRGSGKQLVGALCNLVGYYFIGFPIGVSLMFAAKMGIVGLWTGLTVCVLMQSIFFIIFLSKLNWEKAAKEALVRAGVQNKEEKEMTKVENPACDQSPVDAAAFRHDEEDQAYQEVHPPEQSKSTTTTVGDVLSVRQLVFWRGLAVLVMFVILAAGIVASHFLTRLLK